MESEDKKTEFRINILASLTESCRIAHKNRRILVVYSWLPFFLFFSFTALDSYTDISSLGFLEKILPYYIHPEDYVYLILDAFFVTPFVIGLYRFFILNEQGYYVWPCIRGIEKPKTVFRLFWYFKFQRREQLFFFLYLCFAIVFLISQDLLFGFTIDHIAQNSSQNTTTYYIWAIWPHIQNFVFAALILVWPVISVSKEFRVPPIPSLINAVRGNIVRIFILQQIIYAPLLIFEYSEKYLGVLTEDMAELFQKFLFDLHTLLEMIVYFICICVDLIFISLVYYETKKRNNIV